ncbi:MAG: hypothetical protein J6O49_20985, partial [Bacteroidaceae bacterium]|nr:hypothetical protein [Bacteroidaceae bacterium]
DNRQLVDKYSHGEGGSELSSFIDEIVGKHVEYEAKFLEPTQNFEENYVNLLDGINFDVVTEDDDEKENL